MTGGHSVAGVLVARVVPDVSGLDKHFDYVVPDSWGDSLAVGSMVRVRLHGRRIGGWVTALTRVDEPQRAMVPIAAISSVGPSADVVALAEWAATRWGSPRHAGLLRSASPPRTVKALGGPRRRLAGSLGDAPGTARRVVRLSPNTDPLPTVIDALSFGPALVLHPSPAACKALGRRLQRAGYSVAVMPDDWSAAAAGVDVVVGGRSAAWAPCPGLAAVVVLDEHDEAYQEERSPTWHARDVVAERARRAGASCVLVSPSPTVVALEWADEVTEPTLADERAGWPDVQVVDRSADPPWKRSLISSELIAHLRSDRRVLCVVNRKGRARLLACRSCRSIQRCEACAASVAQRGDGSLACARCGTVRPVVCQECGSTAMANVKPGVSRLREEFAAASGRDVVELTGDSDDDEAAGAGIIVGTEAALHRVGRVDVVAFIDFDAELFAPRYRAAEQAMALLVRAARLVGPRRAGGVIVVHTTVVDDDVVMAAKLAQPSRVARSERSRRQQLGLPPFGALAAIEGDGAAAFVAAAGFGDASATGDDTSVLIRGDDWMLMGVALATTPRPKGSRLRVEVDPPRR